MPVIVWPEFKGPNVAENAKSWSEIYALYRSAFDTSPLGRELATMDFTIPGGSCPSMSFHNPWGNSFTITEHCLVWDSLSSIIRILSYLAYTYIAFRMFIR